MGPVASQWAIKGEDDFLDGYVITQLPRQTKCSPKDLSGKVQPVILVS